jgi:hypothetical protein
MHSYVLGCRRSFARGNSSASRTAGRHMHSRGLDGLSAAGFRQDNALSAIVGTHQTQLIAGADLPPAIPSSSVAHPPPCHAVATAREPVRRRRSGASRARRWHAVPSSFGDQAPLGSQDFQFPNQLARLRAGLIRPLAERGGGWWLKIHRSAPMPQRRERDCASLSRPSPKGRYGRCWITTRIPAGFQSMAARFRLNCTEGSGMAATIRWAMLTRLLRFLRRRRR